MTSLKHKYLIIKEQNKKLSQYFNPSHANILPHNQISSNEYQFGQNPLNFQLNMAQSLNTNLYSKNQFGSAISNTQMQGPNNYQVNCL